jgi:CRP/FNR family transcriptional regulator
MRSEQIIDRWLDRFPRLKGMSPGHLQQARGTVQFPVLEPRDVAYRTGWACPNYVMCISGRTRVFTISESGRELLIYSVSDGGTCVLTTQCLLSGSNFPAESTAETRTELAALPADTFRHLMADSAPFREFVLDDYGRLLSQMITLVDEVAFSPVSRRLASRLLADADGNGVIGKTHQQLALDLGTAREVVSRHLSDWEKAGVIRNERAAISIVDRRRLAETR